MNNNQGSISAALLFSLIVISITLAMLTLHSDLLKVQSLRQKRYFQLNNLYQQTTLKWHKLLSELLILNGHKKDLWSNKLKEIKVQFPDTSNIPILNLNQQETILTKINLNYPDQPLRSTLNLFTTTGNFDLTEIPFVLQSDSNHQATDLFEKIKIQPQSLPVINPSSIEDSLNDFVASKLYSFSWLAIRKFLNLPLSNDPLPTGIYFIQEKGELQLIFIQSEHSQLEFLTSDNQQNILITLEDRICRQLCWSIDSGHYQLFYESNLFFNCKTPPLLIFNGSIELNRLHLLNEFQAVLNVYGQIVINLKETSFMPNTGRLLLISQPVNPFSGKIGQGAIIIKNKEKLTLNLNLFVQGKFENNSQELTINGSLLASQIESAAPLIIKPVKFTPSYFQLTDIILIQKYWANFLWEN